MKAPERETMTCERLFRDDAYLGFEVQWNGKPG